MSAIRQVDEKKKDRRISGEIEATRPKHDSTLELHREMQKLRDERNAMAEQLEQAQEEAQQGAIAALEVSVRPQMTLADLFERDNIIRQVVNEFFKPGIHYGPPFPGSDKKALYKSGAEWLLAMFELRPDFVEIEKVIERDPQSLAIVHMRYEYRCNLHFRSTSGPIVGSTVAVCSTEEDRYKYRKSERVCPACGQETIIKGKKEYGGGWLCFKKKGGCGAKYEDDAVEIESQQTGRVINPDMGGLQHTISAMAQKRAFVLAIRTATGVSAYFDEEVAGEESAGQSFTINGTSAVKDSAPAMADELIQYAESLLPKGHTWTKSQIGGACLKALGIKAWNQPYGGTRDDAKVQIAAAINGQAPETGQESDKEEREPRITDGPDPEPITPVWAADEQSLREFISDAREFWTEDGQKPALQIVRDRLIPALGLSGEARNFEKFQALVLAQYHGDLGDAIQAYTLYDCQAEG
jgi:hypothetical protein